MDRNTILIIAAVLAIVALIFSKVLGTRGKELKEFEKKLTEKMKTYKEFADACKKVHETGQSSAYKELNTTANAVMLLADDDSKEIVKKLISMTEKKSAHSTDKAELHEACKACLSALSVEIKRKPPKTKK